MGFAKRIFLFLVTNFLVIVTLSLVINLFHLGPFLTAHGINYQSLLIFCLIWGMGGAFISLALSRVMAKWLMGVKLVDPNSRDPETARLVSTVEKLCQTAGLHDIPEIGIYNSSDLNAFATGPTKRRSLIAVSSGLLHQMSQKELEGVLAHEIAHIVNGDMVTMTLLQGVVNAFVMFLARIFAYLLSNVGKSRSSSGGSSMSYFLLVFLFEMVFMLLGSIVIAFYSRAREFRADAGGAEFSSKDKMIAALQALSRAKPKAAPKAEPESLQAFKISTPNKMGIMRLFSTHPPLEERIARLQERV